MNANLPAASNFEAFKERVLPPERREEIFATLPSHVKPERFERNFSIALRQHPNLLKCDPLAVLNEVAKAAALGFVLDPQLGEAYLITGWSERNKSYEPQLRVGYRGLIKLGRQSGEIASIYAHEVCALDPFECSLGDDKHLYHKPNLLEDRGEVGAYYAVVKLTSGEVDFEVMTLRDIHRIRDRSDGWRAFKAGKIKSTPWSTDEGEMAKKTVIRRLMKRQPQSPELADALRLEDEADYREMQDVTPERQTLASRLRKPGTDTSGFSLSHVARETAPQQEEAEEAEQADDIPGDRQEVGATETSPTSPGEQEGSSGATAPIPTPGLSSDTFHAYSQALARASQEPSLKGLHVAFLKKLGSKPGTEDQEIMKEINVLHRRRINGELTLEEVGLQVRELAGA